MKPRPNAASEGMAAASGERTFSWRLGLAVALIIAAAVVAAIVGLVGERAPPGQENEVQELGGGTGWTALGAAAGVTFLGWAYTGVKIFAPLGRLRRHRIEIHNWISIGALGFAVFHGVELMGLGDYRGWLSGWIATLLMVGLFVHGWWKRHWVGVWGLRMWRVIHWEMALGTLAFSVVHWLLIERAKEIAGVA